MKFLSICSGIEAASLAAPEDWECVAVAEIEPFPKTVLKHHYPNIPNYGDITKFKDWPHHTIDVLVGGTPCQSFSVAGLRKGISDPRGNLALVFLGIVDKYRPAWILWENVPGVHSSWSDASDARQTEASREAGRVAQTRAIEAGFDAGAARLFGEFEEVDQSSDFDCFLSGLAELSYGIATTVLDAQFFGLAQRRERVFVVGHIGGQWQRAAAVLFDAESLRGNPPPRRQTREGTPASLEAGSGIGGVSKSLSSSNGGIDREDRHTVIPIQEIGKRQSGTPMNGVGHGQPGDPMFTLQSTAVHGIAATLTKNYATHHGRTAGNNGGVAEGQLIPEISPVIKRRDYKGPSSDGDGDGLPLLPVAFHENQRGELTTNTTAGSLKIGGGKPGQGYPAVAFQPCIARNGHSASMVESGVVNALNSEATGASDAAPCVATGYAVRRLTPKEYCRLQGFPDPYLDIQFNGKPAADGPRYKALGNSMAVPVMRWIFKRIAMLDK